MKLTLSKLMAIVFTIVGIGIATMLSYKINMILLALGIAITYGGIIFMFVIGRNLPTKHFPTNVKESKS